MSIQPVNKALEHLINSTTVWGEGGGGEAANAYLKKNSKGEGGGGLSHKQSEGLGGVLWVYKISLK